MKSEKIITKKRNRRSIKVRRSLVSNIGRPRLSVYKSNRYIYAQLIDDVKRETLASASSFSLKDKTGKKSEQAKTVGELLATKAKEKGLVKVVFDRGRYRYHGRVKSLAEGARAGGLEF